MTKELGPLPAPKGEGKDGPKEINYDGEHIALDPIPPRIAPQPNITYFYNKATKYLNGSKVEFNTTPGHEYINIQHGNDKTRLTFFENGDVEIIQVDGNRHDEVSKDYHIVVGNHYRKTVDGFNIDRNFDYFNRSQDRQTFVSERFTVSTNKAVLFGSRGIELRGDVVIRGNVKIDGNLKVNGGFNANYTLKINDAYLDEVKELGDVQGPNQPTQGPNQPTQGPNLPTGPNIGSTGGPEQ
jgi:hypothetical protein